MLWCLDGAGRSRIVNTLFGCGRRALGLRLWIHWASGSVSTAPTCSKLSSPNPLLILQLFSKGSNEAAYNTIRHLHSLMPLMHPHNRTSKHRMQQQRHHNSMMNRALPETQHKWPPPGLLTGRSGERVGHYTFARRALCEGERGGDGAGYWEEGSP